MCCKFPTEQLSEQIISNKLKMPALSLPQSSQCYCCCYNYHCY